MLLLLDGGYLRQKELKALIEEFSDTVNMPIQAFSDIDDAIQGIVIGPTISPIPEESIDLYVAKITSCIAKKIPILGIDSGMHILTRAFGGYYTPKFGEQHPLEIGRIEESPLFSRMREEFNAVISSPTESSVPPGFKLIASSDSCINEGMEHRELPFYGIRFLPDQSGLAGRQVINNFVDISQKKR